MSENDIDMSKAMVIDQPGPGAIATGGFGGGGGDDPGRRKPDPYTGHYVQRRDKYPVRSGALYELFEKATRSKIINHATAKNEPALVVSEIIELSDQANSGSEILLPASFEASIEIASSNHLKISSSTSSIAISMAPCSMLKIEIRVD
jgi:hypothetical protein